MFADVEILKLVLGQYSEDEIWSRFVFELVIWPKQVTLVSWTQPSGSLCLWRCLKHWWTTKTYSSRVCIRPEKWLKPGWACKWQREEGKATEEGDVGRSIPQFRWSSTIDNLHTHTPSLHLQRKITHSICACTKKDYRQCHGPCAPKTKIAAKLLRNNNGGGYCGQSTLTAQRLVTRRGLLQKTARQRVAPSFPW